jgi:hypothetical protein
MPMRKMKAEMMVAASGRAIRGACIHDRLVTNLFLFVGFRGSTRS